MAQDARPFLTGVRVLDVTEALAGPFCSAILSDLGAEVIKVERVDGELVRHRAADRGPNVPFEMIHRNKRDLAINFTKPEGAEILTRLARSADVFVENFRPGVLAKYGLDEVTLRAVNPGLVYCSLSGFGQTGPLREEKGVDLVAQGFGGLISVTGQADGAPAKAGYPIGDLGAGMWGVIGILGAIHRRGLTGEGAYIDVSLTDAIASWSMWELADYQISGLIPGPLGTAHRLTAPYQAFLCRDDRWLTMAGVDRQWPVLCDLLEISDALADKKYATEYDRFENRDELAALLEKRFREDDRDAWIERLRGLGIPAGPVNTIPEMLDDEQYRAREMFVEFSDVKDTVTLVNTPILAEGAPRIRTRAPALGADTAALLGELGFDDAEVARLHDAGVVNARAHAPASEPVGGERDTSGARARQGAA